MAHLKRKQLLQTQIDQSIWIQILRVELTETSCQKFNPHLPGMTFSPREFRFCNRLRLRKSAKERKEQMKTGAKYINT